MSDKSEAVKRWRKRFKEKIVKAMGGGCVFCNYNKCHSALALHHLDPNIKDFSLGSIRANPRQMSKILDEIKKCILVCHNCHSEVHEGLLIIPKTLPTIDESVLNANYRDSVTELANEGKIKLTPCKVCGLDKLSVQKYCSRSCSSKDRYRVDWDSIDLEKEYATKSILKIAEELGCSDGAVHKRLKKLGLK